MGDEQMAHEPPNKMSLITVRPWVGRMVRGLLVVLVCWTALALLGWVGTGLSTVGPFLSDIVYSFSYAWHMGERDAGCIQSSDEDRNR